MQQPKSGGRQWLLGAAGAVLLALASCGGPPQAGQYVGDSITQTDFENLRGWGADPSALTQDHAHSGSYATFVGPGREFGLTFQLPLAQASVHSIKAVEVDAWAYLPSAQASAALIVQATAPDGSPRHYEALQLTTQVHKYGKWQPMHYVFVLPPNLPADTNLRLYLWRSASPEPVYLDDLAVKARE